MKRIKFLGKSVSVALIGLVICAVLAGAALLTYFVSIESTVATNALFEYSEDGGTTWEDAEELDKAWTFASMAGGDSDSDTFDLRLSSDADIDHTAYFQISAVGSVSGVIAVDGSEGLTVYIEDSLDNEVTSFLFSPSDQEQFEVWVELDEMLSAETFTITITVDNTA